MCVCETEGENVCVLGALLKRRIQCRTKGHEEKQQEAREQSRERWQGPTVTGPREGVNNT